MLYVLGFEKICVAISDLYFIDPEPEQDQGDGPERGVRLEIRLIAAQPITVGRPLWRGDLLESIRGPFGSFDRTHHHPAFNGWEPGHRTYIEELRNDPLEFLRNAFADPQQLLSQAELGPDELGAHDLEALSTAGQEIVETVERLLKRISAGELAQGPGGDLKFARVSWL